MRLSLLVFLTFFLGQFANAQLAVSAEGGTNYANLNWNTEANWENADPGYGYYFAIIPEYQIGSHFAIKVEVQQSSEVYRYNQFFDVSTRFTFTRLIPQLELRLFDALSFFGGYNLGFKRSERKVFREVSIPNPIVAPFEGATMDNGFLAGLRYEYRSLYFVVKYHFGFKDIDRVTVADPTGTLFQGATIRSGVLQFGLGYRFEFSRLLVN